MKTSRLRFCAAFLLFASGATLANAQVIISSEMDRGLRYRNTTPFDGESFTQRYSYGLGNSYLYYNANTPYLYYLDYLDRADRAEKFGYRMPIDPFFPEPIPEPREVVAPPTLRQRLGVGFFRRR
ncbi:MAG: hypothetical protein HYX68_15590 [Planctomycetes bacterium]|nr:hypothetical protein [Planctomycetota bacterium]